MRILYLPIFEGGSVHDTAVRCKRGLYTALAKAGHQVTEWDYLNSGREGTEPDLWTLIELFSPNLMLTQFHGANVVTPEMLAVIRRDYPGVRIVNWSGDSHRHSLFGEPMLELARQCDLYLVPNLDVLPDLEAAGINAAYWQIGYEPPVQPLPDVPEYDIVFLGSAYSEARKDVMRMLRSLPYRVGIFGDWEHADGENKYNFAEGEALYKKARLAICDNTRMDDLNYVSDRPIQIMAAGGALCLHQHVDRMQEMMGWHHGIHYVEWQDLRDLERIIWNLMHGERLTLTPSHDIILQAQAHVIQHHTYDARVRQLFEMLEGIPA